MPTYEKNAAAIINFHQSIFLGFPLSKEKLEKRSSRYAPKLSRRGEAERFILGIFDRQKTLEQLEEELLRNLADCFKTRKDTTSYVRDLAARRA